METPFSKRFFCRKLYGSTGTDGPQKGLLPSLKKRRHKELRRKTSMMKMLAGLMSQNNIHASQGHRAALCGVWEKRLQK